MNSFEFVIETVRDRLDSERRKIRAFAQDASASPSRAILENGEEAMLAERFVRALQGVVDYVCESPENLNALALLNYLEGLNREIEDYLVGDARTYEGQGPWHLRSTSPIANYHALIDCDARRRLRAFYISLIRALKAGAK